MKAYDSTAVTVRSVWPGTTSIDPMLNIAALFLVITALLAYLNHRFVRMPTTIGVMSAALVLSLSLVGLNALGVAESLLQYERSLLRSIDFSQILMQGMLSLLLFAGALHVDLSELKTYRLPVILLLFFWKQP